MKAFLALIIALFALTAQAFSPNMTAYNLGFVEQLGLNASSVQDSLVCADAMSKGMQDIKNVIEAAKEGPEEFLLALLKLVQDIKSGAIQEACQSFNQDVIEYMMTSPDFSEFSSLNEIVKYNSQKYSPNVIQQVMLGLNQFIEDDDYTAGQTSAYLLQILTGLEIPPTIQVNVTFINTTRTSWAGFSEGFLNFFNITNATEIDTFGECVSSLNDVVQALAAFPGEFFESNLNVSEKIQLIRTTLNIIINASQSCGVDSADVLNQVYGDLFQFFKQYPLQTLGYLTWDFTTKLPEIEATLATADFEIMVTNYPAAGYLVGQISKMITDIFYDNSQ
jgi:hypothetical protein